MDKYRKSYEYNKAHAFSVYRDMATLHEKFEKISLTET